MNAPKRIVFFSFAYGTATSAVGVPTFPITAKTCRFSMSSFIASFVREGS